MCAPKYSIVYVYQFRQYEKLALSSNSRGAEAKWMTPKTVSRSTDLIKMPQNKSVHHIRESKGKNHQKQYVDRTEEPSITYIE